MQLHPPIHVPTPTHPCTYTHPSMHLLTPTFMHLHPSMHLLTPTYTHTHTHAPTHTHPSCTYTHIIQEELQHAIVQFDPQREPGVSHRLVGWCHRLKCSDKPLPHPLQALRYGSAGVIGADLKYTGVTANRRKITLQTSVSLAQSKYQGQ